MRGKRNVFKNDIIIDLTSMLDVMFIILFVVLCNQTIISETLEQSNRENENAQAKAEAVRQLYEDQIKTADNLNRYVQTVSVMVPYKNDIKQRTIMLSKEGEETEEFDLIGNEIADSKEAFQKSLTDYIQKNSDRPVILSLNDNNDNILYRDEVMVTEIFGELMEEYSNVYLRGTISEEER